MTLQALIQLRPRLLDILARYPEGIERRQLAQALAYTGDTAFGVICNQLARGGFLRQEKIGGKYILLPAPSTPITNAQFLADHIPVPGTSGI